MAYVTLTLEIRDSVATLTLNRPEKRNALSPTMMEELQSALDEIGSGAARVVILTGEGKAFCAGMDLAALKALAAEGSGSSGLSGENARAVAALFRRLYEFPKPLVAAINGHAIAGGCGIATLCDFSLAVPEAKLGFTEVLVGFVPAFVTVFLARQIGERRARDLLLTGRILTAEDACKFGLVNEVIPAERLGDRAREVAGQLLAASPTSILYTKRLFADLARAQLDRELEVAIDASTRIRSTRDFREGLSAFLEKRRPRWTGG